ncbi:MAG TPA: glycosyltransferase family 39 protein [Polyangiaceae bacterium]|nr:glycosyltransferase family 39 protein [Polyangiaceae bacterium]
MSGAPRADEPRPSDGFAIAGVALAMRLAVVAWAATRFPPAEDGKYYQIVATRIAEGKGYTWLWPDGVVTYAAHYPVGYPAVLGALYAVFGAHPPLAMVANAVMGALAALAVHRVAAAGANRRGANVAALAIALHPGLVFYTPAVMTEGFAAALLALAAWATVAARRRGRGFVWVGVAFGAATLVRPQSLLLAPFFGWLAAPRGNPRAALARAAVVTAIAVAACLPWTFRNCARMHACVLVSANAGWNLFIGAAPGATGSWVALDQLGVPAECRNVFGEAEKDACFGRAAVRDIEREPGRFLSLVPKKLAVTFDYAGAAGWYLHSSNPGAFSESAKVTLGTAETIWERLVVLAALVAIARYDGPLGRVRKGGAAVAAAFLFMKSAWVAHLGLGLSTALLGRRLRDADRLPASLGAVTVLGTAATHAVFFGSGRYSLVCFPALAALAGTVLTGSKVPGDNGESSPR